MKTLTRREFIKTAAAAMPVAAVGCKGPLFAAEKSAKRPNIVFVFADQMRAQAMGCMGNRQVITPHLDQFATEGLLVTNAISCAPVCSPYRAQLMTGRYPHSTGVIHNDIRLPDHELVISEVMKNQGYRTGYIGKWHLAGYREDPVDATSRRGWDFWAVRNCSHEHSKPEYWLNDAKQPVRVAGWEPDVQTDLAVEYIKKNKQSPFCLFLSFGPPHNPYKAPGKYVEMYEDGTLKNRPNVPDDKTDNLRQYYAMITSLDSCMGRICDALDDAGISEDTIVVFTSDHGDMIGSQGQPHRRKQRPWEESIHIPFIVRYPRKIKKGQVRDWIVSSVDVMPTLLGLSGISIPSQVEGMDYSSTFFGKSTRERNAAFLFNIDRGDSGPGTDWRGIRTKEWTYAYHSSGDWVLYNLEKDPYQLDNLVDDPRFAGKKEELHQQLEDLRKELGESMPLKGGMPVPIQLPD